MAAVPALYSCFDFRFASDIPLGELPEAAAHDRRPIVTIRYADAGDDLPLSQPSGPGLTCEGDRAVLRIADVGSFAMIGGREIIVAPLPSASARTVRLFLLGSALGVLAYQRGLLPLHANAVVIDGRAHAFCGPSGAGKSTLAAYFAAAGHHVLCDDVCAVSFDDDRRPLAWPGLPRLKLWQDAAEALGHDTATLERAIDGHDKFHVPIGSVPAGGPVPLARIYALERAAGGSSRIVPLHGIAAMTTILENGYRPSYVRPLGLEAAHFAACAAIVRHADIFAAHRAWDHAVFAREAAALVAHAGGAAA